MNLSRIDEAILSVVGGRWKKVARVLVEVENAIGSDLPSRDEGLQAIAKRIEDLVRDGGLAGQGNVQNWRFSEVRRAGPRTSYNKIQTRHH